MSNMVELPTKDEIKKWIVTSLGLLNPDYLPYIIMGVEALYVKLGGERFIEIRMPKKEEVDA